MHKLQITFLDSQQFKPLFSKLTLAAQQEGFLFQVMQDPLRTTLVLQIKATLEALQRYIQSHFSFTFQDVQCQIEIQPA